MLTSLIVAAAVAVPSGDGARETLKGFWTLVERRPAEACGRYLTPAARRQWNSFDSLPCSWKRTSLEEFDRRRFWVVSRPSRKVARVAVQLLDYSPCGHLDHRVVNTVVHRDGRWKIARFGSVECLDRPAK